MKKLIILLFLIFSINLFSKTNDDSIFDKIYIIHYEHMYSLKFCPFIITEYLDNPMIYFIEGIYTKLYYKKHKNNSIKYFGDYIDSNDFVWFPIEIGKPFLIGYTIHTYLFCNFESKIEKNQIIVNVKSDNLDDFLDYYPFYKEYIRYTPITFKGKFKNGIF